MCLDAVWELAKTNDFFEQPRHLCAPALLSAIPCLDANRQKYIKLSGEMLTLVDLSSVCIFYGRCPCADERCKNEMPGLQTIEAGVQEACHGFEEGVVD